MLQLLKNNQLLVKGTHKMIEKKQSVAICVTCAF